jgi:hypothetical protein
VLEVRLDPTARRNARTAKARTIGSIIGAALQQFSTDPAVDFPPLRNTYTVEQAREIIWDISETNFRFELMALDKRASLRTGEDEVSLFSGRHAAGDSSASRCPMWSNAIATSTTSRS